MSEDTGKIMSMLETMMISFDKSFKSIDDNTDKKIGTLDKKVDMLDKKMDAMGSRLEIMIEDQTRKIDTVIEGFSALNDRMDTYAVENAELQARALRLEADVLAIKKRLGIA